MSLGNLTSRHAVLEAIAECDRVGQETFLKKYGFQPARSYFLVHDGRRYDSKAIAGVAHGYQFPGQVPSPTPAVGTVAGHVIALPCGPIEPAAETCAGMEQDNERPAKHGKGPAKRKGCE